jgi:hypothetical protein
MSARATELFDSSRSLCLPKGDYVVFGSGPLITRGIIDATNGDARRQSPIFAPPTRHVHRRHIRCRCLTTMRQREEREHRSREDNEGRHIWAFQPSSLSGLHPRRKLFGSVIPRTRFHDIK